MNAEASRVREYAVAVDVYDDDYRARDVDVVVVARSQAEAEADAVARVRRENRDAADVVVAYSEAR